MDISIIVPVYNVERYLKRCIESLLNTNLSSGEFEILLINDGSTDNSGDICNEYDQKYENIKAYHKENGGLSDARNFGVLKAKGNYLAFVDSDDFVIKDAYKPLLKTAIDNEAEIVVGDAYKYIDQNNVKLKFKKRDNNKIIQDGESFLVSSLKEETMSMSVVLGIYKREYIVNKNLFFHKGLLHEDELWTPNTFLNAKKVIYINHSFYFHYEREGSITQSKDKTKNALDLIYICYKLDDIYNQVEDKKSKRILKDYLCMLYLNAVYIGKLHISKYSNRIDNKFPVRHAYRFKNILKSIIFLMNKNLYFQINYLSKR